MSRTSIDGWVVRALLLAICLMPLPAAAGITPQDYASVGVAPVVDAAVPLDATVIDGAGSPRTVNELITSRPTVLVFADYNCTTLCGPIVAFVAHALEQSGLRSGADFGLVVIGLDPKNSPADATRMRRVHLGDDSALAEAAIFVTADQPTVQRLAAALGYNYVYDQEHDQFVHPGAAYVLRPDGHVVRVLTGLGISGDDFRMALVESGEGRIGTLGDRVRLICSGFDPVHGGYNLMVSRLLAATGLATMLMLGGLVAILILPRRNRSAS
jgi:protein SCO1/2